MKKMSLLFVALSAFTATATASAAVVTGTDVFNAAGGTSASTDLGTATAIVPTSDGNVVFTATPRNLGYAAVPTNAAATQTGSGLSLGVVGGAGASPANNGEIANGELVTIAFPAGSSVTQFNVGNQGTNDSPATITGFTTDPGATLTPLVFDALPTNVVVAYSAGSLTVSYTGFLYEYALSFANPASVATLSLGSPVTGGSRGVSF